MVINSRSCRVAIIITRAESSPFQSPLIKKNKPNIEIQNEESSSLLFTLKKIDSVLSVKNYLLAISDSCYSYHLNDLIDLEVLGFQLLES